MSKRYNVRVVRVVRNTLPIGGAYRCEEGVWIEDRLRERRDKFVVSRTITTGTRDHCDRAKAEEDLAGRSGNGLAGRSGKQENSLK